MKNNILTLALGIGLIIWATIPINEKPVDLHYQITSTAIGTIMCCAAFALITQEVIKKHIDEKFKDKK